MINRKNIIGKTIYTILIVIILQFGFAKGLTLKPIKNDVDILNSNKDNVISEIEDCDDPIKCGQYGVAKDIGISSSNNEITSSEESRSATMVFIKKIINYFLGLLGLLSLIFLIYNGFLIVTAGGNEEKFKNGIKGLKYAAIAIIGVGLSLLFINFIFRIMIEQSGV
ncbi:MAG: hypothetical protein V3575_03165 [Candidatus Absconditabacteria bacterium]